MALLSQAQSQLSGADSLNNTNISYSPTTSTGVTVAQPEAPTVPELYPTAPVAEGPDVSNIGIDVTETDKSVTEIDTSGSTATAETEALQDTALADEELARITAKDSPLLQRARADATRYANRRGLQNSSIAAGAAEGAVVDRALPMALQNAQQANQMKQLEAQLGTQVNMFNADQLAEASKLTAQMNTALAQQDANAYNQAATRMAEIKFTAEQQRASEQQQYNSQVIDAVSKINEQYLRGTQAIDLATIQGTYQQIISTNQTAGNVYQSYLNGIASVMDNPEMTPAQVASAVSNMQRALDGSLRLISEMNNMDFGDELGGSGPRNTNPGNVPGRNPTRPPNGGRDGIGITPNYNPDNPDGIEDYR